MEFYLNKPKKFSKVLRENDDGIFVSDNYQFHGKLTDDNNNVIHLKIYPAYKPGGPTGTIPKNPNKYLARIEIKEK
tara:strand:- start:957 stop:1184 length:228 start_codon:yes stop_codon:yes gene_type:complete